jgi:hypothetical protein
MSTKPLISFIALASLAAAACGSSIHNVEYAPNPGRVADPPGEIRAVILANTTQGCIAEPELGGRMLIVKFACAGGYRGGIGNRVVRLDRVASIQLQQSGEWYRVLVHHADNTSDFDWTSKNLEDMRRLADALTALSSGGQPAPATATRGTSI